MWEPVQGFEGRYEVSSDGQIRNARSLYVLKPRPDADGYLIVDIWKGKPVKKFTVKLHREVAKAFLPNPGNLPEVNHDDGNRANASLANLEWCTVSANHLHAYRVLGRVVGNERAVKASKYGETLQFSSVSEAARAGFNRRGIQHCLIGDYSHHRGYKWSYTNV